MILTWNLMSALLCCLKKAGIKDRGHGLLNFLILFDSGASSNQPYQLGSSSSWQYLTLLPLQSCVWLMILLLLQPLDPMRCHLMPGTMSTLTLLILYGSVIRVP